MNGERMGDTSEFSVLSDEEYSSVINQNAGERVASKDKHNLRCIQLNVPLVIFKNTSGRYLKIWI